jgi:hypothetical protein
MPSGAVLLDRVYEKGTLDRLLDSAAKGTSGALVVHGEAGMGKSALLDYAASSSELPVARVSGVETERSFGFAALNRVLLPFLHRIDCLPMRQRVALESAFGLLDRGPPDRFMVSLASPTLLSVESTSAGLLCIVDDAQWIDTESLQALAFVARRLQAEGIALLFGVRTATDLPSDLAGVPTLEVTGLPDDAATELLRNCCRSSRSGAACTARCERNHRLPPGRFGSWGLRSQSTGPPRSVRWLSPCPSQTA